jgi:hypothetical protein
LITHINGNEIAIIIEIEECGSVCLETWGIEIVAVEEEICDVCFETRGIESVAITKRDCVLCLLRPPNIEK